jgi:hypothetical protein
MWLVTFANESHVHRVTQPSSTRAIAACLPLVAMQRALLIELASPAATWN